MIIADLRLCFIGDSFVAGYGDGEQLGWVGRVAARSAREGQRFTAYNLGVRGHTSIDVVQRWRQECTPRLPAHCERRIVAYVEVFRTLHTDRCWMDEIAADDRAHPGTAGYQQLANLVYPRFSTWIASATGSGDRRRG